MSRSHERELPPQQSFDSGHFPTEVDGEQLIWDRRGSCTVSLNKQGTPPWSALRKARITMSMLAAATQRSSFDTDSYEVARKIAGLPPLKTQSAEEEAKMQDNFARGHRVEVIARAQYSKRIGKPIEEIGLAVWNYDPRFAASPDGVTYGADGSFIEGFEFKAPKRMYRALIEHIEAISKGFTPNSAYHNHIFDSHYDQMTGCGAILNVPTYHYVVSEEMPNGSLGRVYSQTLPVDNDHWNRVLYPTAVRFYEMMVVPLLTSHNIRRIDPPPVQ